RGIRAEADLSGDKIGGKIRNAEKNKVHTMLVIGQKEQDAQSVAVRIHGKGDQGVKAWEPFFADVIQSITERRS
ncbi:MAG: threonine--tRNA ligase, partial [Verrucomicrobiales bacterium]|nr:threonine--tRNA ligase [Verrucomicrobiales bacterium]